LTITIRVPEAAAIMDGGLPVATAGAGDSWSKVQLGEYEARRGVYIHHTSARIIYVGKATSGRHGTFGERLRREFQERASQNSDLHQLLVAEGAAIRTHFITFEELDAMVSGERLVVSQERKALIMEQVLIGIHDPVGNRV
jgi:excinuclease UvrABC nuclease subunit